MNRRGFIGGIVGGIVAMATNGVAAPVRSFWKQRVRKQRKWTCTVLLGKEEIATTSVFVEPRAPFLRFDFPEGLIRKFDGYRIETAGQMPRWYHEGAVYNATALDSVSVELWRNIPKLLDSEGKEIDLPDDFEFTPYEGQEESSYLAPKYLEFDPPILVECGDTLALEYDGFGELRARHYKEVSDAALGDLD